MSGTDVSPLHPTNSSLASACIRTGSRRTVLKRALSDLGISFLSLSEQGIDFPTRMGKVIFGMLALLAEYYPENLGLETKKGKAKRMAKGLHNGLVPFGYQRAGSGVAEPEPETKDGAMPASGLAAGGKSLRAIAQALNTRSYRRPHQRRSGSTRSLSTSRAYRLRERMPAPRSASSLPRSTMKRCGLMNPSWNM